MTVTLTLKGTIMVVLAVALLVLIIYLIVLAAKAITSLKKLDEVLDDAKRVTAVCAERVEKVDGVLDGVEESVTTVVDTLKGNQSVIAAATHVADATSSIVGFVHGKIDKVIEKKIAKDAEKEAKNKQKR